MNTLETQEKAIQVNIAIITPAKPGTLHGNRTTALRWEQHLLAAGYQTEVLTHWDNGDQDMMIALHAARSHHSMRTWKQRFPEKPLILVMTGTDLYRDLPGGNADALASLALADEIVLLQPEALQCIPESYHDRCRVIYQSVASRQRLPTHERCFMVTVIGHLREEKDPLRTALALQHIPGTSRIQVFQLGMAMQEKYAREAKIMESKDPRYHWIGPRKHADTMRWLASSHLMVITSVMEGGAHVVSEAIAAGVPVIASDIDGNRGLLGKDYPGLYPVGNTRALAELLMRAESDSAYMEKLHTSVKNQQALVKPEMEYNNIVKLVSALCLKKMN